MMRKCWVRVQLDEYPTFLKKEAMVMPRRRQARRPGEGSVYQRKDSRWVCEITLEDHSRKQYYFKTEKEALAKQLELRTQLTQGTLIKGPQQTIKQFLEYWLEDVSKPSTRLKT